MPIEFAHSRNKKLDRALAAAQMLCAMAFPRDTKRAGLFLKELLIAGMPRSSELSELRAGLFEELHESGGAWIRHEGITELTKGRLPGLILLRALQSGSQQPKHKSITKSIFLVSEQFKSAESEERSAIPLSEAKLWEYWQHFRPVVHLHAAALIGERQGIDWLDGTKKNLSRFLGIAEALIQRAENQFPPVGRTSSRDARAQTLLDRKNLYLVQVAGIQATAGKVQFDALADGDLATLARFRRY